MMQDDNGRGGGTADYSRDKGGQALGARLRRLSERIDSDGTRIYAVRGVVFEQRWFGVLNQMILQGPTTVGEIAAALQITHVSVSQSCRSLQRAGIIRSDPDPADARRRILILTPAGDALVERMTPLWVAFNEVAADLNEEAGDVVAALDRLDDALARKSMFDRISERIQGLASKAD